jgi:hypothetical protein
MQALDIVSFTFYSTLDNYTFAWSSLQARRELRRDKARTVCECQTTLAGGVKSTSENLKLDMSPPLPLSALLALKGMKNLPRFLKQPILVLSDPSNQAQYSSQHRLHSLDVAGQTLGAQPHQHLSDLSIVRILSNVKLACRQTTKGFSEYVANSRDATGWCSAQQFALTILDNLVLVFARSSSAASLNRPCLDYLKSSS